MSILFSRASDRPVWSISAGTRETSRFSPKLRKVCTVQRTTMVQVPLHCLLACYLRAPRLASPRLQPPTELNSTTTISPPLRDQRQETTLEPTPSADVVDSEPPLARSPSPSDRRIAPHARPRTGYGRFRPQLPRTDSDIDSTSGRSIWNADSTDDKHWQWWAGTNIGSASRQFSFTRQFDTSVIQYSRSVGVKSCFSTPDSATADFRSADSRQHRQWSGPLWRRELWLRQLRIHYVGCSAQHFRPVQVFLVRRFELAARHQSARGRWSLRDWSAC